MADKGLSKNKKFYGTFFLFASGIAAGILLTQIPLFNVVGYELAALMGLAGAVIGACAGISFGSKLRLMPEEDPNTAEILRLYYHSICVTTLPIATAVLIVSIYSSHIQKCNTMLGLFCLIVIPPVLIYTALGLASARLFRHKAASYSFAFLFFIGTCLHSIYIFLTSPTMSVPNITIGFVSVTGFTGYGMSIPSFLPAERAISCIFVAFFLGITSIPLKSAAGKARRFFSFAAITVSGLSVIILATILPFDSGLGTNKSMLNKELSKKIVTEHLIIRYSPHGDIDPKSAAMFGEWYVHGIKEAIDIEHADKTTVYLYKSAEQMNHLFGAPDYFFTSPWRHEIHIRDFAATTGIFKHELVHAIMGAYSKNILKVPYNMGLIEGTATAVEKDYFRGPEFQKYFSAALKAGVIASPAKTMSTAGFGASSMFKSYDMAGGFIGYLIYLYGPERFKHFYASGNSASVYGKNIGDLGKDWYRWLKEQPAAQKDMTFAKMLYGNSVNPAFYRTNCPRVGTHDISKNPYDQIHDLAADGHIDEALKLCNSAYPDQTSDFRNLIKADVLIKAKRFDRAINLLEPITLDKKASLSDRNEALMNLACAYSGKGDYEQAYRAVEKERRVGLTYPDTNEMMLRVLKHDKSSEFFFGLFCSGNSANVIEEAIKSDPEFGVLRLLRIRKSGMTLNSPDFIVFMSNTAGMNSTKINLLFIGGDKATLSRDYNSAEEAYRTILTLSDDIVVDFKASERLKRLTFFKNYQQHDSMVH